MKPKAQSKLRTEMKLIKNIPFILFLSLLHAGITSTYLITQKRLNGISNSLSSVNCKKLIQLLEAQLPPNLDITDSQELETRNFSCNSSLSKWNEKFAVNSKNSSLLLSDALESINYTDFFLATKGEKTGSDSTNPDDNTDEVDFKDEDEYTEGPSYQLLLPDGNRSLFDIRILILCALAVIIILFQTFSIAREATINIEQQIRSGRNDMERQEIIVNLAIPGNKCGKLEAVESDDSEEEVELGVMGKDGRYTWRLDNEDESTEPLL